jgi:hypothetical protein
MQRSIREEKMNEQRESVGNHPQSDMILIFLTPSDRNLHHTKGRGEYHL